ncbi:TPA: P-loop NTPase fold protein [Vibrio parahaemolyticus]
MQDSNYSSDSPVFEANQDRFKRWEFAKRIAKVISTRDDPSSIVLGLYGSWGNGKTSVLNFIEQNLAKDPNVIYLKFNPWRFGSEDDLLKGFFNDIIDALGRELYSNGDKLKEVISKAAPGVGALFGAKGAGDAASSFISGPDLAELKTRVELALKCEKKRVLIAIDDIDRLDKLEIHSLFKLVKLTADFKYTSYILAFDKDVVTASLQERYSNTNSHAGEAFLEKIIQVPLHLPEVDKSVLNNYCFQSLNQALDYAQISLNQFENQYFIKGFYHGFDNLITTPRKAKLYGNTLLFSLPILKGEVNHVDLMLIEGLRVFCPTVYDMIKVNHRHFTGLLGSSQYHSKDKDIEHIKKLVSTAISNDSILDKEGITSLLMQLFPKLEGVFGNHSYASDFLKTWDQEKRVCSPNYAPRYFSYAIQDDDISDEIVSQLIDASEEISSSTPGENPLSEILTPNNTNQVLRKVFRAFKNMTETQRINLAKMIASLGHTLPASSPLDFDTGIQKAVLFIADVIQTSEKVNRVNLAKELMQLSQSITFTVKLHHWLWREDPKHPEREGFSSDEIKEVDLELGRCIIGDILDKDITVTHQDLLYTVVDNIRLIEGYESVVKRFTSIFENDSDSIIRLLEGYIPTKTNMANGFQSKDDLEKNQFDILIEHFGPEFIAKAIEKYFPNSCIREDNFPDQWTLQSTERELYLRQFMWFYNQLTEKDTEVIEG